jgi:hypothetical protein
MKSKITYVAPWLVAAAIGGAVGLAPVASAAIDPTPVPQSKVIAHHAPTPSSTPAPFETGPDPLVPYGTDPYIPFVLGEGYKSTSGGLDLAF